ncbi:putative polyamine oxidase 5 [Habropoda laboriosa]|uniref:Putative polyamine oxidase 5 n=1 Tax=Habropoda laboriosa TaxID=597456 RepID=A0A0L7QYF8_9HYME|nr:PREDICTED: spermine oxidase-like [Habropoda laboriosa]KOC63638.1 putative polyamine oxidase 5 [Habropoda laboriosa]
MFYRAIILFCLIAGTISTNIKLARIVIVGAGASGIAAASKLLENGFEDVLILEAENRIGGRVNTVKFHDYWVDLGAQWVHGEKGNVVYKMVADLNLTDHSDPYEDNIYTSTGELIDTRITKNITDTYVEDMDRVEEITRIECNRSIGECFENKLRQSFSLFPELNETMQDQLLWLFEMMQTSYDPADSWYDISAREYFEYSLCEGDQVINWKERGYSTILDILMKKYPNPEEELPVLNKTILNTEVTKVDYSSEDNTVKISTLDGKEYVADHVIMTPSLGVLKTQYETLFNPPLPENKVRNIKGLGYGNACKIFIAFNDTWFNPRGDKNGGYRIIWTKEEREKLDSNPKTRWMAYSVGFFYVEHKPRLLYIWVSGKGARLMDDVTDEEVYDQVTEMLYNMMSNMFNVTRPLAVIRSKWHQNKHFRGTYSYRSMETVATNSSASQLAEPIVKNEKPVVLFGGEATNEHHFSTVHGAIGSGWREADRLIRLYLKTDDTNGDLMTK